MASGHPDAEKVTTTPRSAVAVATSKGAIPRSRLAEPSRVSVRHVKSGWAFGLSRHVAPIFPAGQAIAWRLGLGPVELVWGRVW
ncbi:hypothetical protein PBI_GOODMAN_60 [Microbacterium phage Goodman]|uniref:Uncharacterized protein n=1 Tax=Microbacterium phage Goodman TaxID=2484206 RepID=A0A3G3LZH2_9CAUD|nr:hypothetical protein HOU56_gp60 [Microbacterium phage Goodman]AYQ99515.1 hypothetical protein PBI_GOODMAN_60 [Microbacterium phage Goodman]